MSHTLRKAHTRRQPSAAFGSWLWETGVHCVCSMLFCSSLPLGLRRYSLCYHDATKHLPCSLHSSHRYPFYTPRSRHFHTSLFLYSPTVSELLDGCWWVWLLCNLRDSGRPSVDSWLCWQHTWRDGWLVGSSSASRSQHCCPCCPPPPCSTASLSLICPL